MLVFHDDRSDVARRALPRLAVGLGVWCLVVVLVACAPGGPPALRTGFILMGPVWLLAMLIRGDVLALQFGRRVRYELHPTTFRAYRGEKLVTSFAYDDVKEWSSGESAETYVYWLGWGYFRSGIGGSGIASYGFRIKDSVFGSTLRPPVLFRWKDRGGLEDVTAALTERIGFPPFNG